MFALGSMIIFMILSLGYIFSPCFAPFSPLEYVVCYLFFFQHIYELNLTLAHIYSICFLRINFDIHAIDLAHLCITFVFSLLSTKM